ncbi:MAG: hypothetical protein RJA22_1066 [Verrucomicrobiota bacterium]
MCLFALGVARLCGAEPFRVVTSIPPVHALTLQVAGGLARVEQLLPAGSSAHDFQFTFRERRRLDAANLVVVNGLGMEAWLARVLEQSGPRRVVEAAAGLGAARLEGNPHAWLDPVVAAHMVTNILVALQEADPARAPGYASNALAAVRRLGQLDAEIRQGLAGITNRALVTAHDAFAYFARRYDLRVVGTLEPAAEVEPGAAHLAALRRTVQEQGVRAIFLDAHYPARRVRQLERDFGVAVGVLDNLEACPSRATAYEDGMRANLRELQRLLR